MNINFNDWLYKNYGIFSDDLTDDDYDMYEAKYEEALEKEYSNCSLVYGKMEDDLEDEYSQCMRDSLASTGQWW